MHFINARFPYPPMREKKAIKKMVCAFTDPIVTHPGYKEVPEYLKREVQLERLKQNLKVGMEEEIEEATDVEAMIYCYTASLVQPLNNLGFRVYTHLFNRYAEERGLDIPEDLRQYRELNEYERRELSRFKRWIQDQKNKYERERDWDYEFSIGREGPEKEKSEDINYIQETLEGFDLEDTK